MVRRIWRYQRGNQNPYMEEAQKTHWPREKRTNNDLQNMTHKTKDRVTRTPLQIGSELRCPGSVSSSWSTWSWQIVDSMQSKTMILACVPSSISWREQVTFDEMRMMSALFWRTRLTYRNNNPRADVLPHSDTLFWFRTNQSLLFFLNAVSIYVIDNQRPNKRGLGSH